MRVRNLLDTPGFGLVARAGLAHLDREIRWVHATELLDPARYLSGGELIHTVALWRREPADSETFASALAASSVSGVALGVGPPPMLLERCPPDLVDACERHGVPLLEVPNGTPFVAVSEAVIESIMGGRRQTVERSLAREQRLVRASTSGGGMAGILGVLAAELGCDCWVVGRGATVHAATGGPLAPETAIALVLGGRRAHRRPATVRDVLPAPAVVAPIRSGARPDSPALGYLVCATAEQEHALEAEADEAVEQAVEFLALEFGHLRVVQASERRFAGQLLRSVEDGQVPVAELAERLAAFGLDPRATIIAVSVAARGGDAALEAVLAATEHVAGVLAGPAVLAVHAEEAIALLACPPDVHDLHERLAAAGTRAVDALAGDVTIGLSDVIDGAPQLRRALVEARQARRFAELRRGSPAVATSRDIGSHALLLALNAEDVRTAFRASLLDALVTYDATHRSELVHTLEAFLGTCGAWQRTAAQLHVHVNTLRYRIKRIEDLTGRDLGAMDDRVDFHLALRLQP